MEKIKLTRQQLYELIWSESLLSISKRYDISDNGLRKICLRMNIPLPPRGYRQKHAAGQKVYPEPLPEDCSVKDSVDLKLRLGDRNGNSIGTRTKEIENHNSLPTTVPGSLKKPYPLIKDAKEALLDKRNRHRNCDRIACSQGSVVNIQVSPGKANRSLRIYDTFIKLFLARGHEIVHDNFWGSFMIYGEVYKISIRESMRIADNNNKSSRNRYVPSGVLSFRIGHGYFSKELKEGKRKLEDLLPKFLAKLELMAIEDRNRRLVREENQRKENAEKEMRKLRKKRIEDEKDAVLEMVSQARRIDEAANMRKYIKAKETMLRSDGDLSEEEKKWLIWARKRTDWYDPLVIDKVRGLIDIGEPDEIN